MQRNFLFLAIPMFLFAPALRAQSAGLPLLSEGHLQFALALQGGVAEERIAGDRHRLYMAVGRSSFGLWRKLDVFALTGVVKQNTDYAATKYSNFDSQNRWAFGGGLAYKLPAHLMSRVALFAAAQGLFFKPQGISYESSGSQLKYRKGRRITYSWRQFSGALFASLPAREFDFYLGSEYLYETVDHDTRLVLEFKEVSVSGGRSRGLYFSKSRIRLAAGINFHFARQHQLGIAVRAASAEDFTIFFGLGQTGSPH